MNTIDFFHDSYAHFGEQVLAAVREEAFGEDIGQNSWVTRDEYDRFIGWLGLSARSRVLEVASGSGGPALYLADRCDCQVTGVDVNSNGIAAATQGAVRRGLAGQATFKLADATLQLPLAAGSFDALLCVDSMNHFPDRYETLRDWSRVLRAGGRAVFTDPVVVTGPVTNEDVAQRSSIGLFVFVPREVTVRMIGEAGLTILSELDLTDNAVRVSGRWRAARERFRDDLVRIEGDERFDGVQQFLAAVHRLTSERRMSRIAWLVEKPR
jgi:SAM-dependent methyltransferase